MINGEVAPIFRVLSNPDAIKILYHASDGIGNSTYTIEELGLSQKRYYTRLKALLDSGLIKKKEGFYRQTALGRMMYDHFLPAMGKAIDAKDELELIDQIKGTDLEQSVIKRILGKIGIPDFTDSTNVKAIDNYESMVVDVIDLFDSAKESIILASNHLDVRVLDANFRSIERGVKNRFLIGTELLSSKLQQLKMMLSPKFTMAMMSIISNPIDMNEIARVADIPYSFCVVDGHHNLIEISDPLNERFILALSIDDRGIAEKLTKFYEMIWKAGEKHSVLKLLSSFKK